MKNFQLNSRNFFFSINSQPTDIKEAFYNLNLKVEEVGVPIDLKYFNTGSQDVLALATSQGLIVGVDIRCSSPIFRFKNDLNHRKFIFLLKIDIQ